MGRGWLAGWISGQDKRGMDGHTREETPPLEIIGTGEAGFDDEETVKEEEQEGTRKLTDRPTRLQ